MILDVEHFVLETVFFLLYIIFDVEEFVSETDFFAVYMFFRKCFFAVFDFFRLETGRLVFLLCVLFLPWDGATQTIAVGIF
jgi:hypothetical protein